MFRFVANFTMMFSEHSFTDRFSAASKEGFTLVEFLFLYEYEAFHLQSLLADNALTLSLIHI